MLCLKATFVVLILVCMAQHILQAEGRKEQQERKGRGRVKQNTFAPKPTSPSHRENEKKSGGKVPSKGRFSTKDKTQCSWEATGDHSLVLSISCTKGNESFHCEYIANPRLCPQYESNSGKFWKQIARSLKKQKKLCHDPKALVKATVCKNASKEAHFSLRTPAKAEHPPQLSNQDCKGLSHSNKLAKEHCSSTWSSICSFFFAMVQNEDC
ncbi:fibroblast growth factor-binding protein 1 [Pygocentrus nattereri]|uniref:Fibroblast growth factor binding protein 1b n=1 Tax=Pygocentrus nattereri TaxID=42514 RepID=A0A3B4ELV1_PYGNA|nr:fibroblast growth factor-binding protein 1 [Pygocentrus nattereri]